MTSDRLSKTLFAINVMLIECITHTFVFLMIEENVLLSSEAQLVACVGIGMCSAQIGENIHV